MRQYTCDRPHTLLQVLLSADAAASDAAGIFVAVAVSDTIAIIATYPGLSTFAAWLMLQLFVRIAAPALCC